MTCWLAAGAAISATVSVAISAIFLYKRKQRTQTKRINALIDYLESVSLGQAASLSPSDEDSLSRLKDEIEKTVSALQHAKDNAVDAQHNYARNLTNIAHQIKTPATTMLLASEQLAAHHDPEVARTGSKIKTQIGRLVALQSDLLKLARLDAGAIDLAPSTVDVFSLISDIADEISERFEGRDVSIEIAGDKRAEIHADKHWTYEALINVIDNCVACAPPKSTVTISYKNCPLYTEIIVADCGPGFSSNDLKKLFERFYVGDHPSPTSTGLGLAFAREIISLQNGSIRARNLPEGGACFEIRFYRHPRVTLDE